MKQIMVASTTLCLAAGRFGLAPTVKRGTNAGLKLSERPQSAGMLSGDPAQFTVVDVLGLGALGHIIGVGIVLGLKGTGQL
jgi:photosystem I subunit 10